MLEKYKALVEEQRKKLAENGAFGKPTEDVTLLIDNETARNKWGAAPNTLKSTHPRLMITEDSIAGIRVALEDDTPTNKLFREYLAEEFDAILPPAPEYDSTNNNKDNYLARLAHIRKSAHNYDPKLIEQCAVKALGYKVYGDEAYAYQATYALKNYLYTLDVKSFPFDQYRAFGYIMYLAGCVYDWCYELLTDEDKEQIIAAVEHRLCEGKNEKGDRFEIGFPPTKQGSVSGHGSEYQLLRDYLAFSIAIYDENPSWWKYVGARFYNDFVPSRNNYYKSGISAQGTGYSPFRFTADLFSAWIIRAATGINPYVGMEKVPRSYFGFEYAPGNIYADGDGPSIQNTSKLRDLALIGAYLAGDAGLLAQGEHLLGDAAVKEAAQGLHLVAYVIFRGTGLKPAKNRFDKMELIQYNGFPLGQYISRERWDDKNSASTFTRIRIRATANHEHRDAGTFQIYYKGMLTCDGGVYDYYGNDHWKFFHTATVGHNGVLVYNPAYRKGNKWYSGSQRYIRETSSLQSWYNTSDFDTGTLTAHESAYRDLAKKRPHYTYLSGDVAKAYEPDTVSYLGRRMLTVYTGNPDFPMALFIYDDVESVEPAFKKTFLMQICSPDAPKISRGRVITENGDGRLVLTSLSNNVTVRGVGGRGYDEDGNYVSEKSRNYLINGKQCHTINKKDDGHWGRIEISPKEKSKTAEFLNLIYVTDKGSKKIAPKVTRINADGIAGIGFGKTVALFATARTPEACEISASVSGPKGKLEYFVSGVCGGTWRVSVDGKDYGVYTATEDGCLLTFTAPAGEVVISPAE